MFSILPYVLDYLKFLQILVKFQEESRRKLQIISDSLFEIMKIRDEMLLNRLGQVQRKLIDLFISFPTK